MAYIGIRWGEGRGLSGIVRLSVCHMLGDPEYSGDIRAW